MTTSLLHQKIQDEIRGIPEGKTRELYELVHQFRLKSQTPKDKAAEILRLAGSWADMPKEEFSSFCSEIRDRRHRGTAMPKSNWGRSASSQRPARSGH